MPRVTGAQPKEIAEYRDCLVALASRREGMGQVVRRFGAAPGRCQEANRLVPAGQFSQQEAQVVVEPDIAGIN